VLRGALEAGSLPPDKAHPFPFGPQRISQQCRSEEPFLIGPTRADRYRRQTERAYSSSFPTHLFGDPVVATAILDRLLHHSQVITIRGDSYRLREKRRSGLIKTLPSAEPLLA